MQRALGITFLFVTHDQEEAMSMATKMCIMEKGAIKQSGTPADLYERPNSSFVATFLGEINCLTGRVEQKTGNIITLSLGINGKVQFIAGADDSKEQRCYVRPEKIFFDSAQEHKELMNSLQGVLIRIDFFGNHTRYQVELADGSIFKVSLHNRRTAQHKISTGDQVRVLFAVSDVFQINEN